MSYAIADDWARRAMVRAARHTAPLAAARPAPLVAILCSPARGRAAASAIALALARAVGSPCALAGAVGHGPIGSIGSGVAGRRAVGTLRERGLPGVASGRLVWLADRRGTPTDAGAPALTAPSATEAGPGMEALPPMDVAARAAASSAELWRAAAAIGAPAALALPFARTDALDRVLSWHDAIVVVREPGLAASLVEQALESLVALGRPVAAMTPPPRLPAMLATYGLRAPREAIEAIAELGLGPDGGQPDA